MKKILRRIEAACLAGAFFLYVAWYRDAAGNYEPAIGLLLLIPVFFEYYIWSNTRTGISRGPVKVDPRPSKFPGKYILIVDDDQYFINSIKPQFQLRGISILSANRPDVAVNILKAYPQDICLVLCDIMMNIDDLPNELMMFDGPVGVILGKWIKETYPSVGVFGISAMHDQNSVGAWFIHQAEGLMSKPLHDIEAIVEIYEQFARSAKRIEPTLSSDYRSTQFDNAMKSELSFPFEASDTPTIAIKVKDATANREYKSHVSPDVIVEQWALFAGRQLGLSDLEKQTGAVHAFNLERIGKEGEIRPEKSFAANKIEEGDEFYIVLNIKPG